MQGADAYMKKFAHIEDVHRRIFAAMLAHLDDSVGEIVAKLRECELEEDTLIVFLSDNGGPTRELTSSNAPLRGEKGQLYEGGIRVPFVAQWKGTLPAGETYRHPVTSLDLLPTFHAAADVPVNKNMELDGVDLAPRLIGEEKQPPRATLYWRMGDRQALRHGDWKIVRHQRGRDDAAWELYDLANDIGEARDQADKQPARLAELRKLWESYDAQMIAPLWK